PGPAGPGAAGNPAAGSGGAVARAGRRGTGADAERRRRTHDAPAPAFRTPFPGGLMMDWDDIRNRWREDAPQAPLVSLDVLQRADDSLVRAVRKRDRIETVVAVVVVVFFLVGALGAAAQGLWLELFFRLVVVAWAAWLPFAFRRARNAVP